MVAATLAFAAMGLCVKLASAHYAVGELVLYRGLVGAAVIAVGVRLGGGSLRTSMPAAHFWRALTGVCSLGLWFYALGRLPLATAMTLNYMSSVWMALFLVGGAIVAGGRRIDPRLIATVLAGFVGVGCVLRPTIAANQLWSGLMGLISGVLAALAYLQVAALGRTGEPDYRIVFYFALGGIVAGAVATPLTGGFHAHRGVGPVLLLLAVGVLATSGQMLMTRAYARGRPLVNASLQYLGIAWAFIIGALVFDDPVTASALLGMVLIVGSGIAATRLRQTSPPLAGNAATAADDDPLTTLPARLDS